jgi:ABC-type oligopeptide transport system substrate-binding subunit
MKKVNLKFVLILGVLAIAALALTACAQATPAPTQAPVVLSLIHISEPTRPY